MLFHFWKEREEREREREENMEMLSYDMETLSFVSQCTRLSRAISSTVRARSRVLVLTAFTTDYTLGYLTCERNRAYCERHGYDFKSVAISREEMFRVIEPRTNATWFKVHLINRYLQSSLYDHVMWIDADAVFIRNESLEDVGVLSGPGAEKDLIVSEDLSAACFLNAGVLVIRVSDFSRDLWSDVWSRSRSRHYKKRFFEQSALIYHLERRGEGMGMYKPFHSFLKNGPQGLKLFPHVCVHPLGNVLQSNRVIDGFGKKNEHPNALIFHAVGMGHKLKAMSAVMKCRGISLPTLLEDLKKRRFMPRTQIIQGFEGRIQDRQ
jgi:hypothetical protein